MTVADFRHEGKLRDEDTKGIEEILFSTITWLGANQTADVEVYKTKQEELEAAVNVANQDLARAGDLLCARKDAARTDAKDLLQHYAFSIGLTVANFDFEGKLRGDDTKAIEKIFSTITWLGAHQTDNVEDYKNELEAAIHVVNQCEDLARAGDLTRAGAKCDADCARSHHDFLS